MDIASIGGILLAVLGILGGMMMEGGSLAQITQPTAMMIVLGGTAGAVMVQFPLATIAAALKQMMRVFFNPPGDDEAVIAQLVGFAAEARRYGIISLDGELETIDDPFMKQALMLAVDGTELSMVRAIMQLELDNKAEFEEKVPQVFESAGGFSPTIGILGAVLGLIQVMQHLDNMQAVGRGIAVAFVATIYGVGVANLFFLPFAGKMRIRIREVQQRREMMLEGVISILEGMNPRMLEVTLGGFVGESKPAKSKPAKKERAA